MAQKFKTGDVVILKSGSPPMTVREYNSYVDSNLKNQTSDDVVCDWFLDGETKQGVFPENSLEPYEE